MSSKLLQFAGIIGLSLSAFGQQAETKFDQRLFQADAILRLGDTITTHVVLSNPCKCTYERDPISPHTANTLAIAAFQAGAYLGIREADKLLVKHGHRKLARALVIADIASESTAVVNNIHIQHKY